MRVAPCLVGCVAGSGESLTEPILDWPGSDARSSRAPPGCFLAAGGGGKLDFAGAWFVRSRGVDEDVMTDTVLSWGGYPLHPQQCSAMHWRAELPQFLLALQAKGGQTLPFGNGRSYGDSCLAASDRVLSTRPLDRILSADWERGILVVEPGITLGEILTLAVPRG